MKLSAYLDSCEIKISYAAIAYKVLKVHIFKVFLKVHILNYIFESTYFELLRR